MAADRGSGIAPWVRVLLISLVPVAVTGTSEQTMSYICGRTKQIGGLLNPESMLIYTEYLTSSCRVHIRAPSTHRIMVKFLYMDISCLDSLQLRDGQNTFDTQLGSFCGKYKPSLITTTGNDLLIDFTSGGFLGAEFKLLLTPYHTGYCSNDDYNFECKNGRCIDHSLYCDDFDNCGDNSDDCYKDYNWWIWMVVGIVVFLVICMIITVVACCLCKRSRPGRVVQTSNQPMTVQYHTGGQTVGGIATNPWYGTPAPQTQVTTTVQTAYPAVQGGNVPAPGYYPAPPPAYTSASGSSVYPTAQNQQTTPGWPSATAPESAFTYSEKPGL